MSELAVLLKARRQAFTNRAKTGGTHRVVFGAFLLFSLVLFALGWLSAPRLLTIPEEILTPRLGDPVSVIGDSALEAAFWLTALLCAVSSFRVMELLFRREDVRVVSLLPISSAALFWDRLLSGFFESMAFGTLLSAFFLPIAFLGHPLVAAACIGVVFCGLVSTSVVTMAVILWMGGQYGGSSGMGDAYGGQGGAFIYAPGAALAGSVINLLLVQLAFSQLLVAGETTRAFWMGVGLAGGVVLISLSTARKAMGSSYFQAAAFFEEAESVGYTIDTEYQTSAMAQPHWLEKLTGQDLNVRRYALQGGRKNALQRYLFAFFGAGVAFALWRFSASAFPTWMMAVLPGIFFVAVTPWDRTRTHDMGLRHAEYLGLSGRQELRGERVFLFGEMVPLAAFLGANVLVFRGFDLTTIAVAATALLTPSALLGVQSLLGRRSNRSYRLVLSAALVLVVGVVATVAAGAAWIPCVAAHLGYLGLKTSSGPIRIGEYQ